MGVLFFANLFLMKNSPKDAGYGELDTGDDSGVDDGKPVPLSYVLKRVFASRRCGCSRSPR